MIYFATIHHNTSQFIRMQEKYIDRYTSEPYKIYRALHIPDAQDFPDTETILNFDVSSELNQHWFRLNYLSDRIMKVANDEDIIAFIDGDAFPSNEWVPLLKEALSSNEIYAVERRENPEMLLRDYQKPYPHPCFFSTTVKFWRANNLSWQLNPAVGAETCGVLLKMQMDVEGWTNKPLLRSNAIDVHPLYFGVYGSCIYHHGCGNRQHQSYDSIDVWNRPDMVGRDLDQLTNITGFNRDLSRLVFDAIEKDDSFINNFFMGIK